MNLAPLTVTTPTASYPILIGPDLLRALPEQLAALGLRGALWLIADAAAYPHYGPSIDESLRAAGYIVHSYSVPSGEASKDRSSTTG